MKNCPDATYELLDDVVFADGTMEVRIALTIDGVTRKMFLPVMDNRNRAISNPNAFDINKARMRCLVKAMALFGLGHYIYAGEDLPSGPEAEYINEDQVAAILAQLDRCGVAVEDFLEICNLSSLKHLPAEKYEGAMKWIAAQRGDAA